MKIYLDNAATTPIAKEVIEEMLPYITDHFGNPSSIHSHGRKTRAAIEKARKIVANFLHASTSEIFFTSGGTEANNMILRKAVENLGVTRIVSTKIEHHCILKPLEKLQESGVLVEYLSLSDLGEINFEELEKLLQNKEHKTLVSLMHANNEIGTLLDLKKVGDLCKKYGTLFHSDTVQTMGYYPINLQEFNIDFLAGSAHKFHGPKGVGFLYIRAENKIEPMIYGGSQERNMRAGTENLYGIVGLGKALELAQNELEKNKEYISNLKRYTLQKISTEFPTISIHGPSGENAHFKILNLSLPSNEKTELLVLNLDIAGISTSGGSACTSGSDIGSHVLEGIGAAANRKSVRLSFSKYNTLEEIDFTLKELKKLL